MQEQTPVICYYHANCLDGFTAAWIVKHLHPDAELIPVNYEDELPALPVDSLVYVVDFTFPDADFMAMLATNNVRLLHFDHHEGAEETVDYLKSHCNEDHYLGVFDKQRSGAGITWDTLHPTKERPHLVNFVEDRDLWKFNYPQTKFFGEGLSTLDMSIEAWDWAHLKENFEWVFNKGKDVYGERVARCISQIETTGKEFLLEFEGKEYPVHVSFLADPKDASEQTNMVVSKTSYDVAFAITVLDDGRWKVRVTTAEDGPNANRIAKCFSENGGGHPHAAGFVIEKDSLVL